MTRSFPAAARRVAVGTVTAALVAACTSPSSAGGPPRSGTAGAGPATTTASRPGARQTTATSSAKPSGNASASGTSSANATRSGPPRISSVASFPYPLSRMAVAVSGSTVVVLGGLRNGSMSSGDVFTFDPVSRSVRRTATLEKAVHDTAAAVAGGAVVLFGGGAASESSDVQRLSGGRTTRVAALPQPRSDLVTASVGGTVYVIGGYTGRADTPDVLATTDGVHFRVVGRLPVTVRYPAVAVTGTTIWVIGGDHALAPTDVVQRIDTTTGRISLVGHLAHALGHASAWTRADGTVLVAGGRLTGDRLSGAVSRFDTRTLALTTVASLPRPTADMGVSVLNGVAYLFGGEAASRITSIVSVG
ncbi:MAG: hypothetical protein QOI42_389 [Frankiaceae bacterium]|nr:hypothetical protein [Frankiaceae bacterium]